MVAGSGFEPGLAAPCFKKPEIGPIGALGGRAPGGLLVPEGLLGGLEQRVLRAELVQGDAGGRQSGSQGLDFGGPGQEGGRTSPSG